MFTNAVIERIRNNLFSTPDEMVQNGLKELDRTRVLHLRDMYNYWLQYPTTREKDILAEIEKRFSVDKQTAYNYLGALRCLLGDLGKTNKDFIRFQFNELLRDAFDMAKRDHNAEAMIKALDKYAKYNNLDKADNVDINWDSIMPQQFVMSDDPTTIGFKAIPNVREKIKAKINQYWNQQIEDVRFEELEGKKIINQTGKNGTE